MLIGNIDTYEFGVVYNKSKFTPFSFLENLNKTLNGIFDIKVYYTQDKGYDESLFHLASKVGINKNNRFTLIAFLYVEHLNKYITVVQHSQSNYLVFKCYGLFQEDEISIDKSIFTLDFMLKLLDYGYQIRNVKLDIAFDFNIEFNKLVKVFSKIFEKKKRYIYKFKENETVYFNTENVNECFLNQKRYKENYNCNQKNNYYNIVLYNKSLKNSLDYTVTRLEFSFKNIFNNPNIKHTDNYMHFLSIVDDLKRRIEKYLTKSFDISIQKHEDLPYLKLHEVAVNNANYFKEKKVI